MSNSPPTTAPLTLAQTRNLLEQLGHFPNRRLGQNFLIDGNIVRKSLQMADVGPKDSIVEIGPGLGTLTASLLQAGAQVYAIEYDQRLAASLSNRFSAAIEDGQLQFSVGDAVEQPLATLPAGRPFKIVANLPYAVTTPWLEATLFEPHLAQQMVLMLQKEAADRLTAECGTKSYSAITVLLAASYDANKRHHVSRQCFYPVPDIDSVLIQLQQRESPQRLSSPAYLQMRNFFIYRRKQIGSLVRRAHTPALADWLDSICAEFDLSPSSRPEAIPVAAWIALDSFIH